MKGIILAGGKGTRLHPMTYPIFKPLLPVYDKPMIFYPLDVLLQAGIRDILIITPPNGGSHAFERLLGDGSDLGVRISFLEQPSQRGIADALILGESFLEGGRVCLILGDNILYSPNIEESLNEAMTQEHGATIFGYPVEDPRPFGVVEFDADGKVRSLEEKPEHPRSNYIVPGLYFYDAQACEIAKGLRPSARGELEITDVNIEYMRRGQLRAVLLDRDFTWFDAGSADSLLETAAEVRRLQAEKGRYIGCIEETAWRKGFLETEQLRRIGERMQSTPYGQYLLRLTEG